MTETGDVKQRLPVLDQSDLLNRLTDSYANGRGSVRVLVINDEGRELAVDYKVCRNVVARRSAVLVLMLVGHSWKSFVNAAILGGLQVGGLVKTK